MSGLLVAIGTILFALLIYLAALSARWSERPQDFVDAGGRLPAWALIFGSTGVMLSALGLPDHLLLVRAFGLQYSHVGLGLVLASMVAALLQKRLWLAARILDLRSLGEMMGAYYGSTALRIILLGLLFLFAVPFAAYSLGEAGALMEGVSNGALPASGAVWTLAFFLFLAAAIGGWRGIAYAVAALSFFTLALLLFTGLVAGLTFDGFGFPAGALGSSGILADRIPGVVQFTAGIGKEAPLGGIWTTVAILSFCIGLAGVATSPGMVFLTVTADQRRALALTQVWAAGGLAGALLLLSPLLAAELQSPGGAAPFAGLIERLGQADALLAAAGVAMLLAALCTSVAFFAGSGASIATIELTSRFLLPGVGPRGERLAARIALAAIYFAVALAASATPLSVAVFAPLALSLSVQLLPAVLGLCWSPWISRGGVLAGLVFGMLLVAFTEPFGLILFEGMFVELPWGRWPLTVHSAGWGLVFNLAVCLLVSLFTRGGEEREKRQRLHDRFASEHPAAWGGPGVRGAKWSLALLWGFLALGPGAILANTFFSQPILADTEVTLGFPSLLAWQILFWLVGVLIVWWLSYQSGLGIIDAVPGRTISLADAVNPLEQAARPQWITRLLARLAARGPVDR